MRISSSFHTCPNVVYTPSPYNPDGSGWADNNCIFYSSSNGSILINGTNNSIFCTSNPNTIDDPIGNGDGSALRLKQDLEQIINQEIVYSFEPEKTKIINEHKVFLLLKQQHDLMQNSVVLTNFYNNNLNTNKKKVTFTESYLNSGETNLAIIEKESIVNDNNIDSTYKIFYDLYFNLTTDSLTLLKDSTTLFEIANSCSFNYGVAVFQARALYQKRYKYSEAFIDNCTELIASNRMKQENFVKEEKGIINLESIYIYPNPSKDKFIIKGKNILKIKLFDFVGREIDITLLKIDDNSFMLTNLKNEGIYNCIIETTNETKVIKIQSIK